MELVKLEINLKEPALFSSRKLGNFYIHTSLYIPAGTLKGALVNVLFARDAALGKTALEELSVSNAYPKKSVPTHAYIFLTKRKENKFLEKKGILEVDDIFEEKRYNEEVLGLKQLKSDFEPKSVIGEVAEYSPTKEYPEEGQHNHYVKATASFKVLPNVAVSKKSGSSQRGMLFSYEIVERGTFWGLVDYDVWKKLKLEDELAVSLGKGRIGGLAEVKVVDKSVEYAEKGNAYCFTQCLPSFGSAVFFKTEDHLSATSVYQGWFTNEYFASRKPSFAVMKEGSLVKISDAAEAKKVMPAGLNFLLKVRDAYSLLKAVGEVS